MSKITKKSTVTPVTFTDLSELLRGVDQVIGQEMLEKKLRLGEQIRLYLGVDPTGPDIHIGHAVILRAMRVLQNLGHEIILLFGDFTARIGDPTGKDASRPILTHEEILENAKNYKEQAGKILDFSCNAVVPARIEFNAKWLDKLKFQDVMELSAHFTVQQMLERDMFAKRMKEGRPIHLHEFFYPLMQGYDSVAMEVDLEVGGSDQLFNMLAGRTLMDKMLNREKAVMTFDLLEGLDGRKMSKSYGNIVGVLDSPDDMYGKIMSLDDHLIGRYYTLCTDMNPQEAVLLQAQVEKGELHPRDEKMKLAKVIVDIYHEGKGEAAEAEFKKIFQEKNKPSEMPEVNVSAAELKLIQLVSEAGFASSNKEARRLIEQGGVRLNDQKITDIHALVTVQTGDTLQVGKRKFATLVV